MSGAYEFTKGDGTQFELTFDYGTLLSSSLYEIYWTEKELTEFLNAVDKNLYTLFQSHNIINGKEFLTLKERDLIKMKITDFNQRTAILNKIKVGKSRDVLYRELKETRRQHKRIQLHRLFEYMSSHNLFNIVPASLTVLART